MNKKTMAFLLLGVMALSAPAFAHKGGPKKHHGKHHKEAAATTPAASTAGTTK